MSRQAQGRSLRHLAGSCSSDARRLPHRQHQQLWEPKVDLRTAFNDVAGLKPGAPMRMGGLDVGR